MRFPSPPKNAARWVGVFGIIGIIYLLLDHHAPDVSHARVDKPVERMADQLPQVFSGRNEQ